MFEDIKEVIKRTNFFRIKYRISQEKFEHIKKIIKEAVETKDFSRVKYSLSTEEKEYIFALGSKENGNEDDATEIANILNSDDNFNENLANLAGNMLTEKEAIKSLASIDRFNHDKTLAIILSLPTDNLKMQYLGKIEEDEDKLYVINGLESNENKKTASLVLPMNLRVEFASQLPVSPENDEYREKLIESLSQENSEEFSHEIANTIRNLSRDEAKVQYIDKVDNLYIDQVFNGLKTTGARRAAFDKLSDNAKYIICSDKNAPEISSEMDEYRVELLEKLLEEDENYYYAAQIIRQFSSDDLILRYMDRFNGYYFEEIFDSLKMQESKKKNFDKLSIDRKVRFVRKLEINPENDKYRIDVINSLFNESDEDTAADIIANLSSDSLKLGFIDKFNYAYGFTPVREIFKSLESSESKILVFNKMTMEDRVDIAKENDALKITPENDKCRIELINKIYERYLFSEIFKKDIPIIINNISSPTLKSQFGITENVFVQTFMINTLIVRGEEITSDIFNSWKLFENDGEELSRIKKNELLQALKNSSNIATKVKVIDIIMKNPSISKEKIGELGNILEQFEYSNSQELINFQDKFIPLILSNENPTEVFGKIEETFLKNNLPMMAKIYQCLTYLYPDFTKGGIFDFSSDSRVSPELINPVQTRRMQAVNRDADPTAVRFQIVYNDLFRIASRSNNRSFVEYLNNIEQGNILFLGITNGIVKYEQLDDNAKQILSVFSAHLNTLYEKTQTHEKIPENLSPVEKIMFFNNAFKPTERYSLPDRIVRNFAYQAGFDNFEQLKRTTIDSIRNKEEISRRRALDLEQGKVLTLEQGDFVRAIGTIDSFGSSLNNGNVCKEFLGTIIGTSNSDTTPLDIDFTLINENGKDIYHNIEGSPTGFGFGNIYIILKKDNPEINITRDSNGNLLESEYRPDKIEMFGSKTAQGGYENHWGARTGIASSDIDYILFKEQDSINSFQPYLKDGSVNYSSKTPNNDLAILKNEIVKNGFYIPVVDFSGKLIFSVKEYEEIKEKMEGLSYYGSKEYHLGQHSQNDYVEQIKQFLNEERESVKEQSDKVYESLKKSIGSVDKIDNPNEKLAVKNKIDLDITNGTVEILETGSSSRGTNIPYEYDFDYIVRVDAGRLKRQEKLSEINQAICDELGVENVPSSDFRDVEATVKGLGKIDLDITYVQKTNKTEYSTEMSAKDRMDTLESIDPEMKDEVVANIVLAKMLLKKSGCYKPRRKSEEQGGLGGIGIENWITQNGGTLESAARSFLEASEGRSYDEFKTVYHVHDYGKNHISRGGYPYNDFVFDNMNATGYEKMKTALGKYINYVEGKTTSLPEIDEYLSTIRDKAKNSTGIAHNQELNSMFNAEASKIQSNESVK